MNYILLFLSVVVGYIFALFLKKNELKSMEIFLAFSGAFLLSITVFELMPQVFAVPSKALGVYIMAGVLLQIFLEFFSKGAEHGHVHGHPNMSHSCSFRNEKLSLAPFHQFEYSCIYGRFSNFRGKQFIDRNYYPQNTGSNNIIFLFY